MLRRYVPFFVGVGGGIVIALALFDVSAVWIGVVAALWFGTLVPLAASFGRRRA